MFDVELEPNRVFELFDAKLSQFSTYLNRFAALVPGCRVTRPFRIQNGLRFTGLSAELLEDVKPTTST